MFVFIGAEPAAEWLPAEIARNANGYLLTGTDVIRSGLWPARIATLVRWKRLFQACWLPGIFAPGPPNESGSQLATDRWRLPLPMVTVDPAIALLMKTGAAWRVDMPRPMPSSFREQIRRPVERAEQPVQYLTAGAYTTIVLARAGLLLRVMRKYYFGVHWPPHVRQRILSRLIDASLRLRHARPSRATRHCNRRGRAVRIQSAPSPGLRKLAMATVGSPAVLARNPNPLPSPALDTSIKAA